MVMTTISGMSSAQIFFRILNKFVQTTITTEEISFTLMAIVGCSVDIVDDHTADRTCKGMLFHNGLLSTLQDSMMMVVMSVMFH